jgi:hypothetical protein
MNFFKVRKIVKKKLDVKMCFYSQLLFFLMRVEDGIMDDLDVLEQAMSLFKQEIGYDDLDEAPEPDKVTKKKKKIFLFYQLFGWDRLLFFSPKWFWDKENLFNMGKNLFEPKLYFF